MSKTLALSIRTAVILVIATLIFGCAIWWLNQQPSLQNIWNNYDFDKHELISFCEKTDMIKFIRQPVNTFSNIVYLIVAIFILRKIPTEKRNATTYTDYKILFGYILLYVFCVSTFYHASLICVALRLDYSGVYLLSLFPLMYFSPRWSDSRMARWRLKQLAFARILFSIFFIVWLLLSILIPSGNLGILTVVIIFVCVAIAYTITKAHRGKANLQYLILSILSGLQNTLYLSDTKHSAANNTERILKIKYCRFAFP